MRRSLTPLFALLVALLLGFSHPSLAANKAAPQSGVADDFLIVHCLLPGQLRQLGRNSSYVSARRPARLSATDCAAKGGEFVRNNQTSNRSNLPLWLPLAKDGDVNAQLMVGELLEQQQTPAYTEAQQWYERAAEQGNSAAMLHLSRLADAGLGQPADRSVARYWMRRALTIDQTNAPATTVQPDTTAQVDWQPQQTAALALSERSVARLTQALHDAQTAKQEQDQKAVLQSAQTSNLSEKIAALQAQLLEANQALKDLQDRVAERVLIGPTISLIEPSTVQGRTRGTLEVDMQAQEVALIGRIDAPAGLLSALLDQQPISVNAAGVFQARLAATGNQQTATITAIDQQGKKDRLTLALLPPPRQPNAASSPSPHALPPDPLRSIDYGRFHALVIGNNRYPHLPNLQTAVNDAEAIAAVLREQFSFSVTVLTNATRYTILSEMNRLRETLTKDDNLLIYYAGHGELDEVNRRGHWLPVDAEPDNSANWISNTSISDLVNAINARHVFMVVDSCYAGTLTRSAVSNLRRGMTDSEQLQWTRQRVSKRARLVLTSGGVAPVLDEGDNGHSVFAGALLDALSRTTEITASRDLYQAVAARVTHAAADFAFDQLPEYAPLRFAGHEAGEFFLVPKPSYRLEALP